MGNRWRKGVEPGDEDMRDLNYALKQLCDRNRDGGGSTQRDRQRSRIEHYPARPSNLRITKLN